MWVDDVLRELSDGLAPRGRQICFPSQRRVVLRFNSRFDTAEAEAANALSWFWSIERNEAALIVPEHPR